MCIGGLSANGMGAVLAVSSVATLAEPHKKEIAVFPKEAAVFGRFSEDPFASEMGR